MPSDKPVSQTDVYTKAANGATAGSYHTDGSWNIGGWSTYPSADELALRGTDRPAATNPDNVRK